MDPNQNLLKDLQRDGYCFLRMPGNLAADLSDVFGQLAAVVGPAIDGHPLEGLSSHSGRYFGQSITPGIKGSLWLHRRKDEEQEFWPELRQDSGLSQDKLKRIFDGLQSLATAAVHQVFREASLDLPQVPAPMSGSCGDSTSCPLFAAHRAAAKAGVSAELSESVMALIHYGQPKDVGENKPEDNEEPCPTHTDYTLFTLIPEHQWPGLQMVNASRFEFVNVHDVAPPGEGWVLCLAGECFMNGSLRDLNIPPTQHRVVGTFTQRTSCALFHYPHRFAMLPGSKETVERYLDKAYLPSVNYKQ